MLKKISVVIVALICFGALAYGGKYDWDIDRFMNDYNSTTSNACCIFKHTSLTDTPDGYYICKKMDAGSRTAAVSVSKTAINLPYMSSGEKIETKYRLNNKTGKKLGVEIIQSLYGSGTLISTSILRRTEFFYYSGNKKAAFDNDNIIWLDPGKVKRVTCETKNIWSEKVNAADFDINVYADWVILPPYVSRKDFQTALDNYESEAGEIKGAAAVK
jgi:hypothetical protein